MDKRSDLLGPSPHPAQEPQKADDLEQMRRDYTQDVDGPNNAPGEEYRWVTDGKHVLVGPKSGLPVLNLWRQMTGKDEMHGPYAHGFLEVIARWNAEWMIRDSTISLHLLDKILRTYSKDMGWKYRAITDEGGMPFEGLKTSSVPGIGEINPGVKDWKNNEWSAWTRSTTLATPERHAVLRLQQNPDDEPISHRATAYVLGVRRTDDRLRRLAQARPALRTSTPTASHRASRSLLSTSTTCSRLNFNEAIMDKTVQRQSRSSDAAPRRLNARPDPRPDAVHLRHRAGPHLRRPPRRAPLGHPGSVHAGRDHRGPLRPEGATSRSAPTPTCPTRCGT
jgi:hypothetical protein